MMSETGSNLPTAEQNKPGDLNYHNKMAAATYSPVNNNSQHCDGNSPSHSMHSSTLQMPDGEGQVNDNSTQYSAQNNNDASTDDALDFSDLHDKSSSLGPDFSSTIEIHPQNDVLGGTASHKFIKRPLNAYMIWTRQERKKLLKDDPKMKMNEMGERWKKMTDHDKKPYFDLARKYQQEHKQVLQDHPEFQYAPSKKKGPKSGQKDEKQSVCDSIKSQTVTPVASPRSTPAQTQLPTPTPTNIQLQQNHMFSQFQNHPLAQVLGRATQSSQYPSYNAAIPGALLAQQAGLPQYFQPQNNNRTSAALGGSNIAQPLPTRPENVLGQYYTSLCQPSFPTITESPNMLGMFQPQYLLEQYHHMQQQQQQQQQQQNGQGSSGGGGGQGTGGGHYG